MTEFEIAVLEELRAIRQLLECQVVTPPVQVDEEPDACTVLRLKQAAKDMLADIYKDLGTKKQMNPSPKQARKRPTTADKNKKG